MPERVQEDCTSDHSGHLLVSKSRLIVGRIIHPWCTVYLYLLLCPIRRQPVIFDVLESGSRNWDDGQGLWPGWWTVDPLPSRTQLAMTSIGWLARPNR